MKDGVNLAINMNVQTLRNHFSGGAGANNNPPPNPSTSFLRNKNNNAFTLNNNNNSSSSSNITNGVSYDRQQPQQNGATTMSHRTQIPVSKFTRGNSSENLKHPLIEKWQQKFEESERNRKILLTQNQKLSREHADLDRKFNTLQQNLISSTRALKEREDQLEHLRKLSEQVCKEYDQMKNQYDLETSTMQKAIQRASQWYKENRELKRRSTVLIQKVMQFSPENAMQLVDESDGAGSDSASDEIEVMRKTIQELNKDVARLQAELNAARLQEFEAQEQSIDLTSALDEERKARERLESELKELRAMKENMQRVSKLVAAEVGSLRAECSRERQLAAHAQQEAAQARKERTVLAHQSQLLLLDAAADEKLVSVLQEVAHIKATLEEERNRHAQQIRQLQVNNKNFFGY
ncbi:hypothetical protein LSTR_LSTR005928 [Laodelphax striatellus]|uniref:Uncharacterized protein n=1 Tax=Laodelphax striatellus TaxID=195883 RepID=A0A482WGT0_LAOST|nr:hypothetical protein LSTR_LSTR005928 [Laodelphax striatellus]